MADTARAPEIQSPSSIQKKNSMDMDRKGSATGVPPLPMRKLSRSQSITSSIQPTHFYLPPELESQWRRRRESLEKLQLDKVAPWMHMHDFTESEGLGQDSGASSP